MNGNTTQIGRYGEDLAAAHLIEQGFSITRRNFRVGHNEIDIIAENETHIAPCANASMSNSLGVFARISAISSKDNSRAATIRFAPIS